MLWFFLFVILLGLGVVGLVLGYLQEERRVSSSFHIISPAIHGAFDYIIGVLLIALPWLLDFAAGGAETWVPVVLGAGLILYSLITDYEWGLVRRLPMPLHLVLDGISGLFLFASPMLFGFYLEVMDPHLAVGMLEVVIALVTKPGFPARRSSSDTASEGGSTTATSSTGTHPMASEEGREE